MCIPPSLRLHRWHIKGHKHLTIWASRVRGQHSESSQLCAYRSLEEQAYETNLRKVFEEREIIVRLLLFVFFLATSTSSSFSSMNNDDFGVAMHIIAQRTTTCID